MGRRMRTTSLKSIYLTEKELKQAISNWIKIECEDTELAAHLEENVCDMSWSQDGQEFIISPDGEFIDNKQSFKEFITSMDGEFVDRVRDNEEDKEQIMTKDNTSEQNNDHYVVKVQETESGELFVDLPQKLIDQLGWEVGDEVEWDETELWEEWGEHKGFTLSNKSKLFRDTEEEE
jgi:hypothetical protein